MNKCKTTLAFLYYIAEKENNFERKFTSDEVLENLNDLYQTKAQAASTLQYYRKRGLLSRIKGHAKNKTKTRKNFYAFTNSGFNRGKYYFMESKKNDVDTSFVLWLKIKE